MRVLDLFAGLGGWGSAFLERGHEVVSVDFEPRFDCTITADVFDLNPLELGAFDVVTASPPCETFSMLTVGRNWTHDNQPKTERAWTALMLVYRTVHLIDALEPAFFIIENPRAKLRKLPPVQKLIRHTVTYCQYGAPWMKPTDIWGGFPASFRPRAVCGPRQTCHVAAPRGSRTGIQGDMEHPLVSAWHRAAAERYGLGHMDGGSANLQQHKAESRRLAGTSNASDLAAIRALVPPELSLDFALACERDLAGATHGERLFA